MEDLKRATELKESNPSESISILSSLVSSDLPQSDSSKVKESAILLLGKLYADQSRSEDLASLIQSIRPLFTSFPKAKTAKIVRSLIDYSGLIRNSQSLQIKLCEETISWCQEEKRTFLKQRLETKLAQLYLESGRFKEALDTLSHLLKEVKKLDDKLQLVEIQVIESKVFQRLCNIPRAKAALTAARSCANSIYCPAVLQADIDLMSGILNCEEKDYRTGYSYFFEAHEGFNSIEDPRALQSLKYMLMSKIMARRPEDVYALVTSKGGVKYTGREIESMIAVAKALELRSLHDFQKALENFTSELKGDFVVDRHIQELYETMLEQHLIRIIEPFSKVEIQHVADLIDLPIQQVTSKLSQMILDKKFEGTLDQGIGALIVYDEPPTSKFYSTSLKYLESLNTVVDSLFQKATVIKN
jgi:26S proteasome regulatory subunit N6